MVKGDGGKDIYPGGTQDCLRIEREQTWHMGTWHLIKIKWETLLGWGV